MENTKIEDFKNDLERKMQLQAVSSNILLSKCRLIDEISRKSGQYQDPFYLPFYYHFSKFINPKSVMQIGLYLGLPLCCFLQGNGNIERLFCFQNKNDKQYYSEKLAFSNIKDILKNVDILYYYGSLFDVNFQKKVELNWDLVLINEENINIDYLNSVLDISWKFTNLNGFIVVDKVKSDKNVKTCFLNFCKINNRDPVIINTRYGTGIIQR
jgi:hypothetical protein